MKKTLIIIVILLISAGAYGCSRENAGSESAINIAVEFVDHAACAHVAKDMGWYEEQGLNVQAFNNYATGMALASALKRGEVDAAYVCLIPAINAYANGNVPVKIVTGTHKYGYGVLVDPKKVKSVQDLEKTEIRIACPREGSVLDVVMHQIIDKCGLDKEKILNKVQHMPPPKILLALKSGKIDAGFLPEQFPSMGEENGFKEIISAKDVWPGMQGSVLVVRSELIKNNPETVEKLVRVTQKGTGYINNNPEKASQIVSEKLSVAGEKVEPLKIAKMNSQLNITPEAIEKSLTEKMNCTTDLSVPAVQETINYMSELGYIEKFEAENFVDVRFIEED